MKSKTLYLLIICANFMVTTIEATMCSNTPIIYNNLKLPSTINLVKAGFGKGFLPDKYIEINGVFLEYPNRFKFYLMEDGEKLKTANIPFAFQAYHTRYYRVNLNDWIKPKKWGRPEWYRLPFTAGKPFILEFVAAPNNTIIIYVNDRSFATFHRGDLSNISQLFIDEAEIIKVNSLILCDKILPATTPAKPPFSCRGQIELNNLKIPSLINLVDKGFGMGFARSKRIIIHGTPTAPTCFDINFAEEGVPEDTADIPLHFSPNFAQKKVIRDTWIRGTGWTRKETSRDFPFKVGQPFELEFRAEQIAIRALVDGNSFELLYGYNMSKITQLEIKGAIDVRSVVLCK